MNFNLDSNQLPFYGYGLKNATKVVPIRQSENKNNKKRWWWTTVHDSIFKKQ